MTVHVLHRSTSSILAPCVRANGWECVCHAKKKSPSKRSKQKRASKRKEAFQEDPIQTERGLTYQDAITVERSFASVEPPDFSTTETLPPSTQARRLERQDAFDERTLKSGKLGDSTVQQDASSKLKRENVLTVCRVTSFGMALIGVLATFVTPTLLQKAGSGIQSVSQDSLLHLPSAMEVAVAVGAGCCVTAARFVAMQSWEDLAKSVNAANSQVR
jgi:hypothetical protein